MSLADKLAQTYMEKRALTPEQMEARTQFERSLRLEQRLRGRAGRATERAEERKVPFSVTGFPTDVAGAMIPDLSLTGLPARLGATALGGRAGFELMREAPIGRMTGGEIEKAIQRAWGARQITPEIAALGEELSMRTRMGERVTMQRGPIAERISRYLPQSLQRQMPEVLKEVARTEYPRGREPRGGGGVSITQQFTDAERRLVQEALEEGAVPRGAGALRRFASKYLGTRGAALGTLGGAGLGLAVTGIPELIGNVLTRIRGGRSTVRAQAQAAQALRRAEDLAEERERLLASLNT